MESTRKPPEPEKPSPDTTNEEPLRNPSLDESPAGTRKSRIRTVTEGGPTAFVFTGMRGPKSPAPTDKPKKPS